MMNCPKCHFLQPEDQYCARCGVDVTTYQAPAESFFQRLIKSPFAYIFIIIVLSVSTWFYTQNNEQNELQERVRFLKGELSSTELKTEAPTTLKTSSFETENLALDENSNPASSSDMAGNEAEPSSLPSESISAEINKEVPTASSEKSKSVKFKIEYVELSQMALQRLVDESKSANQFVSFGDYSVGLITQLDRRTAPFKTNSNLKTYETKEQLTQMGSPSQWFVGNKNEETDLEYGISTVITLSEIEDDVVRGEVEIIRSLRESPDKQSPPIKRSFPAQFELGKETGMFISQILPHRPISDLEDELLGTNLFQIYQSPRFQNRNSEFVVFIQMVP